MTIARKDHRCLFCRKKISKGTDYHRVTVRPWDHPDNEGFSEAKGHHKCWAIWDFVGGNWGWEFPRDKSEFREMVHEARMERNRRRMA